MPSRRSKDSRWNGSTLSDVPAHAMEVVSDGVATLFDDGDDDDGDQ